MVGRGMLKDAKVPCNGCTACCWHNEIFLFPEHGDDPTTYEWVVSAINPITGQLGVKLKRRKDGACINLTERGCNVYDRRPAMCRAFDCRRFWMRFTNHADRKRAIREGLADKAVMNAGRARLSTLTAAEIEDEKRVQAMGWMRPPESQT